MRAVLRTALVLVVGAGLVVGAVRFPDWQVRMAGSGDGATAQAAENPSPRPVTRSAVVCPGPESIGVRKIDATTALSPSVVRVAAPPVDLLSDALAAGQPGTAAASAGSGSVVAAGLGGSGPLGVAPLTAPGAASVSTSQPRSILLSGNGSLAPGLVAAQTTLITSSDLRGLSTIACQAPSAQTWLVGGAGTTGHRGRVILSNPTPNAVTVNLAVFGAKGQLSSPAARGIVVKPHKRSVVLLDAIAHGEASPVIHVMASGGVISAALNDTWLDGTTPAGADDVAGTTPGRHLVIPGVLANLPDDSGVLRLAATDGAATVRLRVLGSTGPIAASVPNGEVQVAAHTARDIALTALPVGYSGIELTSTAPVVAGLQVRTGATVPGGKRDIAWSAAEPALSGLTGVALGDLTAPWTNAFALTAPTTDSTVDVVYVGADGSQSTTPVSVAAGTTTTVGLPRTIASTVTPSTTPGTTPSTTPPSTAPVSVWLRPRTGSVVAAFATAYLDSSGMLLSVSPLVDAPLRFTPVAVYPLGG